MAKKAFLFPGQASQFVGMGMDLYKNSELAREIYDRAEGYFDFSIKKLSFYGPLKELTETRVTQPAIFILSVILFQELKRRGIIPDLVAGHSLGEYSALVAAGAVSFEDGLELVKVRAESMQKAGEENPGTMAAIVGMSFEQVKKVLEENSGAGIVTPANNNAPQQVAISGEISAVQMAMQVLKESGAKRVIELQVGGAFHSPLMKSAKKRMALALEKVEFREPEIPIFFNVTGKASTSPAEIKKNLYEQITSPVLWVDTIMNMYSAGADHFLEVGPGKVLQGLTKRILKGEKVTIEGFSSYEDLKKVGT